MKNILFLKILRTYFFIVLSIAISFFVVSKEIIKNSYIDTLKGKLKDLNYVLSQLITDKQLQDKENLSYILRDLNQKLKIRITIINLDGVVLADSEQDSKIMDNHLNRPEIQQALKEGFGTSIRYSTTLKEDMLYVASLTKTKTPYILRTSYHLKDVKVLINQLWLKIFKFLIFLTLIVILISFMLSYSITKPIKQLTDATKKVSEGDFDTQIFVNTKDELKILAENFNFMVSKIKGLIEDISYQRDRLKNIFSSIQEAVVLLDKEGKILLYNESFKKLCKTSPEGKNYLEVLISSEFNEIVKKAIKENKNLLKEINILEESYLCSISFVSEKELVVLFYNITEHKQLQSIKKELVANIAHELKTPLTTIRGFTETLDDEITNKEHKHYLERILSNTDRLTKIVNDLTTLSQLEDRNFKLELEEINIVELVEHIKQLFEMKVKQKNLDFVIELKKDLKPIKADKFRLEQVLINLIDNALRYTEKGYIKISITQDEQKTYIVVEDTGIGIPKEYHSRVFERFFVVDKARSRQTGGTGLGLSIVKHIVELHKGEIFLESQVGVGTKFKVVLNNEL